jgi:xylan 1,4-beta-xylosidase
LLHGGFGLLTVGNLRKARYWALRMLEMLGPDRLVVEVKGDGAESLVQSIAASRPGGGLGVLVWNGTLDQSKQDGAPLLDRNLRLRVVGLPAARYRAEHQRLDREHSNIVRHWRAVGSPDWPDAAGWARLRQADKLDAFAPPGLVAPQRGEMLLEFPLPMPGVSLIQLVPVD